MFLVVMLGICDEMMCGWWGEVIHDLGFEVEASTECLWVKKDYKGGH